MPRKLRVEYSGAVYHLMNRGDRREPIFHDEKDRERFLQTLGEACDKTGWQVHALCLMSNHFHLVVETPKANLVAGMKWFLGTYTSRFNRRHRLSGHLFSGRYKSLVVDSSGSGYMRTACEYVHLNPVRAKVLRPEQRLRDYVWSSYGQYLKAPAERWPWLRVDRLLGEMRIPKDSPAGRRQFEIMTEEPRRNEGEEPTRWKAIRRGWYLGDQQFKEELLEQMNGRLSEHHNGTEKQESSEQHAERLVAQELQRRRWKEADLALRRKGDREKLKIALRLRRETTMTLKWIAQRLQMGTWTNVANCLAKAKVKVSKVGTDL